MAAWHTLLMPHEPHPDDDDPPAGEQFPDGIGWLLHQLLNPEPAPGPPYVHTFNAPEPDGYDENGDPIYLLKPTYTITRANDD